jgi:putative ABC transport system permease protein
MPVFVSRAFAEAHGRYQPENMSVTVLFPNNRNALAYANRLVRELGLDTAQYQIHPAVLAGADINTTTMYLIMGILVAFVMFVGFLLIYNVLFVSVSKDVRFYGLLKTLGTTPRQLRRIVNGQVLRLCAVGLPIGLGLAALTSLALVPAFLTGFNAGVVISFSPLIYVGGAVFTLLTAYVSAFTSAKKAARVSPIEAIRYTGEGQVQVKARTSANETAKRFCTSYLARLILKPRGKPWRMAWRNVFRQRKQAAVVLLSLFLGVTVYMTVMTVVFGFDIDNELDTWHTHDFAVTSRNFGALTEDMVRDMAAIPGVTQLNPTTITAGQLPALAIPAIENAVPPRPAQTPFGSVYGIDTATLLLLDGDTDMDIAAFERGEIVLLESRALRLTRPDTIPGLAGNNLLQVGDTVDILLGRSGEFLAKNVTVGGHIYNLAHVSTVSGGYAPISLIMSNVFLQQHVQDLAADRIEINVAPGMDSQVNGLLTALVGQSGNIRSRYEARQAMEDARVMMFVLGVGISAVLGVIGIFNFINVITVGLLVRRREFAALESVGMSRKQMRAMLRWEGAVYWMVTVATSLTAGTAVAYGLFALLRSASPSQFPVFNYPVVAVLVAYVLIIAACSIVPEAAYKGMSKQTLVERLREAE